MIQLPELSQWRIRNLDQQAVDASAFFDGRPVMALFFSLGCPNCLSKALPIARQVHEKYPEIQVLGIHTRFEGVKFPVPAIQAELRRQGIAFPVVLDVQGQTFGLLEAEGTPHWVMLHADGRVEKSIFGSMPNAIQRIDLTLREWFPG